MACSALDVQQDFIVQAFVDEMGMSAADDGGSLVAVRFTAYFDVQFLFDSFFQ